MTYDDWKTTPPDYFDGPDPDCVESEEIDDMYDPGPDCCFEEEAEEALTAWERNREYQP